MYRDFGTVFLATLVAVIFVIVPLVIGWLVAPSNKTKEKLETYECGEVVEGSAWLQFNVRFYVIALIFLIFDVEVVFLVDIAVVVVSKRFVIMTAKYQHKRKLKQNRRRMNKHLIGTWNPVFICCAWNSGKKCRINTFFFFLFLLRVL